jgi:hypothetical protein
MIIHSIHYNTYIFNWCFIYFVKPEPESDFSPTYSVNFSSPQKPEPEVSTTSLTQTHKNQAQPTSSVAVRLQKHTWNNVVTWNPWNRRKIGELLQQKQQADPTIKVIWLRPETRVARWYIFSNQNSKFG